MKWTTSSYTPRKLLKLLGLEFGQRRASVRSEGGRRIRTMDFTRKENDRRNKYRFEIERDMRFKMADQGIVVASGTGRTLNIGSGGVAFSTDQELTPGGFIELSISWPV